MVRWLIPAFLLLTTVGCSRVHVTNYYWQHHSTNTRTVIEESAPSSEGPVPKEETLEEKVPPVPLLQEIPSERLNDKDYVIERLLDHIDQLNAYIEEHRRAP